MNSKRNVGVLVLGAALWVSAACAGDHAAPIVQLKDAGSHNDDDSGADARLCASCGGCEQSIAVKSASHVTGPVFYADPPPVGGDHNACWAAWGVHSDVVDPARWVHNLEHGGVVFLYHCKDGCAAEQKKLEALSKGRAQTLVSSYAQLPTRFGIVAWGKRLLTDCVDETALLAFYTQNVNHAPEAITSGPPDGCPP